MEKGIQINQLLLERESCLSEVFDLEQQISIVLGQRYPFDPPVDLPSMQKRKKTRKEKPKKTNPIRLRELDPATEYAYRIVYTEPEAVREELHIDPRALTLLLTTELPHLHVQFIETVAIDENKNLIPGERLYTAPSCKTSVPTQ